MLGAFVEEPDRYQREEGHARREIIQGDQPLVTQRLAKRLHDGLPGEGPDIYHRVEDREALRTGFRRSLFSDRAGDNALDKSPAAYDQGHDRDNAVLKIALQQSRKGSRRAVFNKSGGLKPSRVNSQS